MLSIRTILLQGDRVRPDGFMRNLSHLTYILNREPTIMPMIRVDSTAIQTVVNQHSLNPFETPPGPHFLWLASLLSDANLHGFPGGFAIEDLRELLYGAEVRKRRFGVLEGAVGSFGGDGEEGSGGELGGEEEVMGMVVNDGGCVNGVDESVHGGWMAD